MAMSRLLAMNKSMETLFTPTTSVRRRLAMSRSVEHPTMAVSDLTMAKIVTPDQSTTDPKSTPGSSPGSVNDTLLANMTLTVTPTQTSTQIQQVAPNNKGAKKATKVKGKPLCMTKCKHKGKEVPPMVQCHICQIWLHFSCIKEKETDVIGLYTCEKCRKMPDTITSVLDKLLEMEATSNSFRQDMDNAFKGQCSSFQQLSHKVETLHDRLTHMESQNNKLSALLEAKTAECKELQTETSQLRTKVSDLTQKVQEATWKAYRQTGEMKTLLIGSDSIRSIQEDKLKDTTVICKPDAQLSDFNQVVSSLRGQKYSKVVLVTGGKDCCGDKTASDVVQSFKELCDKLCVLSPDVTISSICPRLTPDGIMDKIRSVNAGLQVLCDEMNMHFINNDPMFHLADQTVNDGYLMRNGIHLTHRATNRLATKLGLTIKDADDGVCDTRRYNKPPKDGQPSLTPRNLPSVGNHRADGHRVQPKDDRTTSQASTYRRSGGGHYSQPENRTPCHNCGEDNHNQHRCRFSYRLKCRACGEQGHKAKHHSDAGHRHEPSH